MTTDSPKPIPGHEQAQALVAAWLDEAEITATRRDRMMETARTTPGLMEAWLITACEIGMEAARRPDRSPAGEVRAVPGVFQVGALVRITRAGYIADGMIGRITDDPSPQLGCIWVSFDGLEVLNADKPRDVSGLFRSHEMEVVALSPAPAPEREGLAEARDHVETLLWLVIEYAQSTDPNPEIEEYCEIRSARRFLAAHEEKKDGR